MLRFTLVALTALAVAAAPLLALASPLGEPTLHDPLPGPASTDPAVVGAWGAPFEGKVPAISMALTPTGAVVYWGGIEARDNDQVFFLDTPHHSEWAYLEPPYTAATATKMENPPGMLDLFCAGQTILPDGSVLTAGGSVWQDGMDADYQGFVSGLKDAWRFDPEAKRWTRQGDMAFPRWYPTVTTMADGRALVAGGIDHLVQPHTMQMALETFDDGAWTTMTGAENLLPMYPRLFTVPSGTMKGDLFYTTSATLWGPFGEHPAEATWSLEQVLDNDTKTWRHLGPSLFGARQHAATVMLPLDPADGHRARILTFGGSIGRSVAATSLAEIADLSTDPPTHEVAAPLHHARWHANGVLLPDGTVLAVGGGLYDNVYVHGQPVPAVMVAEQYDPATGEWSQRAPMTVPRMYHSTALLLPDGRVLVGGHVPLPVPWTAFRENVPYQDQVVETRFEIYEPPYLHWGVERPRIEGLPAGVAYGQPFDVGSPDAARVVDAILVRPGATTHAWDASQRAVVLPVLDRSEGRLTFQSPPDGDVAAPGPWMLFLRVAHENGLVPGEARFTLLV